jgi:hypothetical protein
VGVLACSVPAGCGGDDDEPAADTPDTVPELTLPQTEEVEPPPTQTETTPPEPTETVPPPDNGGGTPAPEPEPPPDAPQNDTPPPPDSPAERFEEFCNDNPGACG